MVKTVHTTHFNSERGMFLFEIMVALAILAIAIFPLAYSYQQEARLARAHYEHAVAMEIVDGELERLMAGNWSEIPEGTRPLKVTANSARNLPKGTFKTTRHGNHLRVSWKATVPGHHGEVSREVTLL